MPHTSIAMQGLQSMRGEPLESIAEQANSTLGPATGGSVERGMVLATFLFARLHHFSNWCDALGADAALAFVSEVRQALSEPVLKLGGDIAHRRPDSLLAVFTHRPEDRKPNHAQRGLHAAILAVHESVQLAKAMASRHASSTLPPLRLAAGVHLGVGELSRRRGAASGKVFAVGEGVEVVRALADAAIESQWSVAATLGTHVATGGRTERGRSKFFALGPGGASEVVEITGLVPRSGSTTPATVFQMLRTSLLENQQNAAETDVGGLLHPNSWSDPQSQHHERNDQGCRRG